MLMVIAIGGAAAQTSLAFGARPAHDPAAMRPDSRFVHAVEPGVAISDAVFISNFSNAPSEFAVYAVDMVRTGNGGLAPGPRSAEVVGSGHWISVHQDTVVIPPRTSDVVGFDIKVPSGTPPDRYTTAIVVEPVEAVGSGAISAKTRIGLPIRLQVLGTINLAIGLGPVETTQSNEGVAIGVLVSNQGDVTFEVSAVAEAQGWLGGAFDVANLVPTNRYVGPGEQTYVRGVWEDPPLFGRYHVRAIVKGTVGTRQPVAVESEEGTVWLVPWTAIIVALVVSALVAWFLWATRESRHRHAEQRRREKELVSDFRSRQ